jgi:hypothetical protein
MLLHATIFESKIWRLEYLIGKYKKLIHATVPMYLVEVKVKNLQKKLNLGA